MDFSIEREINLTQQYILIFQDVNIRHNILLIDELSVDNDPSAGSPTETLLRLLLPLDNLACKFLKLYYHLIKKIAISPNHSPTHPIGRSDGRCVQRAGTYSVHVDDKHLLDIPSLHVKISKHDYK